MQTHLKHYVRRCRRRFQSAPAGHRAAGMLPRNQVGTHGTCAPKIRSYYPVPRENTRSGLRWEIPPATLSNGGGDRLHRLGTTYGPRVGLPGAAGGGE